MGDDLPGRSERTRRAALGPDTTSSARTPSSFRFPRRTLCVCKKGEEVSAMIDVRPSQVLDRYSPRKTEVADCQIAIGVY